MKIFDRRMCLATGTALALALGAPTAAYAQASYSFSLSAQDLGASLRAVARRTGENIVFDPAAVRGKRAPALNGSFSAAQAIERLLAGSGLGAQRTSGGSWVVSALGEGEAGGAAANSDGASQEVIVTGTHIVGRAPVGAQLITVTRQEIDQSGATTIEDLMRRIPQNFGGAIRSDDVRPADSSFVDTRVSQSNDFSGAAINLRGLGSGATLVLINGRRTAPSGSAASFTDVSQIPLSAIDRIEIVPDGASAIYGSDAVGGVINIILRRDFRGLELGSRYTYLQGTDSRQYSISGSGGFGWNSGHLFATIDYTRLGGAAPNSSARATGDLRQFGGIDQRSLFCDPGNLRVGSRNFAIPPSTGANVPAASSLIEATQNRCNVAPLSPEREQLSTYVSVEQRLTPELTFLGDARYSNRDSLSLQSNPVQFALSRTNPFYVNPTGGTGTVTIRRDLRALAGPARSDSGVATFSATGALTYQMHGGWQIRADFAWSSEHSDRQTEQADATLANQLTNAPIGQRLNPFASADVQPDSVLTALRQNPIRGDRDVDSETWIASISASGNLLDLPAGSLAVALGAEYRHVDYSSVVATTSSTMAPSETTRGSGRSVRSAYAEMTAPLFSRGSNGDGIGDLTFSAAGRYDSYSDYGSAVTPQLALEWEPITGLRFRGQWKRSFKAPDLELLNLEGSSQITDLPDDANPAGFSVALLWFAGNRDLVAERSETWTAGVDVRPRQIPGLRIEANYFNTRFENQIGVIPENAFFAFSSPVFAPFVIRDPSAALRQRICDEGYEGNFSSNPGGCLDTSIDAVIDTRVQNLASVKLSGIDFRALFERATSIGRLTIGIDGTYLLNGSRQVTPALPFERYLNTTYNPLRFKGRASVGWERNGVALVAFMNHQGGYRATPSLFFNNPQTRIGSWTTVDADLSYAVTNQAGPLSRLRLGLNVRNLLNAAPPLVLDASSYGYDPMNANLDGRTISISVRASF